MATPQEEKQAAYAAVGAAITELNRNCYFAQRRFTLVEYQMFEAARHSLGAINSLIVEQMLEDKHKAS